MASADPRDPIYGKPYTDTPVQQAPRSGKQTVLDLQRLATVTITVAADDNHRLPSGYKYHE